MQQFFWVNIMKEREEKEGGERGERKRERERERERERARENMYLSFFTFVIYLMVVSGSQPI